MATRVFLTASAVYFLVMSTVPCRSFAFTPSNSCQQHSMLYMSTEVEQEYAEQEALIVDRGMFEETLITNISPLEAPKIKGGKVGGFGKASGSSKVEGKEYAKVLKKEGVVRIDNVLSSATADGVRDYLYALRERSEKEVEEGTIQPIQRFATVLLKKNRCDLTVPLGDKIITTALDETLRLSPISYAISNIFGNEAVLHEFSCLISDSGSQRQVIHPDTPYIEGKDAVLYTCFIALQDVTLDMGPTVWLPGTNNKQSHVEFRDEISWGGESKKDALIRNTPAKLGLLKKGSCAIFDSRTLHCGTANTSGGSRALFYFSFRNAEIGYTGNPASIRKELGEENVSLGDLVKDLKGFGKGKGTPLIDRLASL
jgi:ectoine hydroxylase-related dioxygenase (phytanoyl-CoA dioxygenase family)